MSFKKVRSMKKIFLSVLAVFAISFFRCLAISFGY